jgi:hypothetical protein
VNAPEIRANSVNQRDEIRLFHNDFHSCGNLGGTYRRGCLFWSRPPRRRPATVTQSHGRKADDFERSSSRGIETPARSSRRRVDTLLRRRLVLKFRLSAGPHSGEPGADSSSWSARPRPARRYRTAHEGQAYISTQHPPSKEGPWLSRAHGDQERPHRSEAPASQRPEAADRRRRGLSRRIGCPVRPTIRRHCRARAVFDGGLSFSAPMIPVDGCRASTWRCSSSRTAAP